MGGCILGFKPKSMSVCHARERIDKEGRNDSVVRLGNSAKIPVTYKIVG